MFHDAKKIQKNTPPRIYFFITFATRKCELSFNMVNFYNYLFLRYRRNKK